MDHDKFIEVVSNFSVSEPSIKKDDILLELASGEIINIKIKLSEDSSVEKVIDENNTEFTPEVWISERLGRLSTLSRSMLSTLRNNIAFVSPEVDYDLHWAISDQPEEGFSSACDILKKIVDTKNPWESHILYITSNAGEGKTTVLEKMALDYAKDYKPGKGKLIVPIALSGKPFIRFDDLIIGTLANRFKFTGFFYDSFISLVKMNMIIPAFDGFEEMFVESPSGAAISAMIEFIKEIKGKGTVLVAARSAYYEYQNLTTQAKLYDAISSYPVAFSKIKIRRWNEKQFVDYGKGCGFITEDSLSLYSSIKGIFGENHPILTRAVLASKLYSSFEETKNINDLLSTASSDYNEFYYKFVYAITAREANKWLTKKTTISIPVLTLDQHIKLLSMIAREMWTARSEILNKDVIDMLADLFIETEKLGADEAWQIKNRIRDHAILRMTDSNKNYFEFDHEDFYHFFLGEMLSGLIINKDYSDLFNIMRRNRLPKGALDACVYKLHNRIPENILSDISEKAQQEQRSSYARENASYLMLLLNNLLNKHVEISGISFEAEPLNSINISDVCFNECIFTALKISKIKEKVMFNNCNIIKLEIDSSDKNNVQIIGSTAINSLYNILEDVVEYSPSMIRSILQSKYGFSFIRKENSLFEEIEVAQSDELIQLFEKIIRMFFNRIEINSDILKLKLGTAKYKIFWENIYPKIKDIVLDEVPYRGGGTQKRIRIICRMEIIQKALETAEGDFEKLITFISNTKKKTV